MEAADLVKKLEEKWGVSAAAPVAVAAVAGAAAEAVEEQTEFDVIIKEPGARRIRRDQDHSSIDKSRSRRIQSVG